MKVRVTTHSVRYLFILFSLLLSTSALASAGRYSSEFAWNNPADIIIYEPNMGIDPDQFRQKLTLGEARFSNNASFTGTSGLLGLPPDSGTAASHTTLWIGPSLNYILRLSEKLAFGFSLGHPFETSIEYPQNSLVRFNGVEFTVNSLNIAPSLAYLITPHVAVGGGFDAQQVAAKTSGMFPAPFLLDELFLDNDLKGWGWGWHAGITARPFIGTFIGLSYTSSVRQHLTGNSTLTSVGSGALVATSDPTTPITMPSYTALKLFQALSLNWGILAEIDYTDWSTVQELLIENTALGVNVSSPTNFHGVYRFVGGARYAKNPWVVFAGAAYEQSPTNNVNRTITGSEINYWALGLSGEYSLTKNASFSLGYYYYPVGNVPIANTTAIASTNGTAHVTSNELEAKLKLYV